MANLPTSTRHIAAARVIMRSAEGADIETRRLLAMLANVRLGAARAIAEVRNG